MAALFKPQDWYWSVANQNTALVYSSARNIYVDPSTDTNYGNWLTSTGLSGPYQVASESDIWYYTQSFMPVWWFDTTTNMMSQPSAGNWYKGQLNNYNAVVRYSHVNGGMVAAGIPVNTDDYSRNLIQGGYTLAQANPNFTTQWYGSDGNWYLVDAAQMIQMGNTVGTHTNDCFTVFAEQGQAILTNATTQPSQIDAAYSGL